MKNKLLFAVVALAAMTAMYACGSSNSGTNSGTGTDTNTDNPNNIPYTIAQNYFVLNSVEPSVIVSKRIDSLAEFNLYFGAAATMGSQPTAIDFNNQFVIAVIAPTTNRETTLNVENLTLHRGILTLSYSQTVGQQQSFSVRPALAVIIDRKYDAEVLVVEK